MELPRALMRWGAILELFPRELATALGPLIQRLDLVIGPLQTSARQGDGDPDGFRGIARRGSYERLLISEWLLADEFPEEFARRAAMGEHSFLELARRQPAGARTSVALFDAGPNQLGAPRIAHLAALIVLARRAEAAGVGFLWGVLQQPSGSAHTSLTAGTILQLLQARSLREATDADVATWREHAGSEIGADDLWIVGGERLCPLPASRGASLLQIADPYLPDAAYLNATITHRGMVKPMVTLELPSEALCVRLLRDPLATRRAELRRFTRRFTPTSHLVFASGGRKLLARSGTDHVMVYSIPNSPHAEAGKPKAYHTTPPRPILAAGRIGKSLILVTTTDRPDKLCIEYVGRQSGRFEPIEFYVPLSVTIKPPQATSPRSACYLLESSPYDPQWLVVIDNHLLRLRKYALAKPMADRYATIEMKQVIAAGPAAPGCAFIGKEAAESSLWALITFHQDAEQTVRRVIRTFADALLMAHFGYGGIHEESAETIAGISNEPGRWTIVQRNREVVLDSLPDDEVVGVVALGGEEIAGKQGVSVEPGLIVLKKDRRRISVMGKDWVRSVPPASSSIVCFAASHFGPEIAYLTEQGELVVYSLALQAPLCRYHTMREP